MNAKPESSSGQSVDRDISEGSLAPKADGSLDAPPTKRRRTTKPMASEDSAVQSDTAKPEGDVSVPPSRKRRPTARKAEETGSNGTTRAPMEHSQDMVSSVGLTNPSAAGGTEVVVSPSGKAGRDVTVAETSPDEQGIRAEGDSQERGRRRNRNRRRGGRINGSDRESNDTPELQRAGGPSNELGRDEDDEDEAPAKLDPSVVQAQLGEVFSELLSGDFDKDQVVAAEEAAVLQDPGTGGSAPAPKRVLLAEPEAPKLQKVLAQSGIGSRRDMEQMILDGLVTVNGHVAHVGQRISFGDHIKVDGRPIKVRIVPPPPRIIAYHKPVGEVVTHDDPQQRPTVFRRLPRLPHGKWQSVGRLDINTEGLLLFTNSGELANKLMHPRFGVEREYAVRVLGTLGADAKATLLEGVCIDGQNASFVSIADGGGEGVTVWSSLKAVTER